MAAKVKIGLLVNEVIGPSIRGGPGREGYDVAKEMLDRGVLGKVYCLGVTGDHGLPAEKLFVFCHGKMMRYAIGMIGRMQKRYPVIRGRRRIEQWMDSAYSKDLTRGTADVLYCPKPLYPKTIRKAKSIGMRVVIETSVLHPRFNLDVVSAERKRLGVRGAAGYTDEKRVRNIEEAVTACDKIFPLSEFVRDSYVKYGVPERKFFEGIEFSPPGVDTERFAPDANGRSGEFTVLHVSSISVIKGVQYLLDAWEKVANEVEGRLLIVGPADRDMRRILNARQGKNVEWVGRVSDPSVYYKQASVFVSPSISDSVPRTVLEAMACGAPAIVSDHCGVSKMIEQGVNGFVYHYNDVPKLASLIKWSFDNRADLRHMGENARVSVQGYSVADYGAEIEKRISAVTETAAESP